ncbi:hypothetical protein GGI35DRAFT_491495 [Trichoderma velutinum]
MSPARPLRPDSVPSTPTTAPLDSLPTHVRPPATTPPLIPNNGRSMTPHVPDQPANAQSKWSSEEDATIIKLRGKRMKWEDKRIECDEERKNELARLYERSKSDMARRVGVHGVPLSTAAANASGSSSSRTLAEIRPQDDSALLEMRPSSPSTSYSCSQFMPPMTSAQTPGRGHDSSQPHPQKQPYQMMSQQHTYLIPYTSPETVVLSPSTPHQPPSSPVHTTTLVEPINTYRCSPGPGLAPIQPHPSSHNTGPLPGVAQLTAGTSPYRPPSGSPTPSSLPTTAAHTAAHSIPLYVLLEQTGTKRAANPDMVRPDSAHKRRLA